MIQMERFSSNQLSSPACRIYFSIHWNQRLVPCNIYSCSFFFVLRRVLTWKITRTNCKFEQFSWNTDVPLDYSWPYQWGLWRRPTGRQVLLYSTERTYFHSGTEQKKNWNACQHCETIYMRAHFSDISSHSCFYTWGRVAPLEKVSQTVALIFGLKGSPAFFDSLFLNVWRNSEKLLCLFVCNFSDSLVGLSFCATLSSVAN